MDSFANAFTDFKTPDMIKELGKNKGSLSRSLEEGLDYRQRKALNDWLYFNCVQEVHVENNGYMKKVRGVPVYKGGELPSVMTEFILWEKLRKDYEKDFADFVKERMGKETTNEK